MARGRRAETAAETVKVRERIDHWRKTRKKRSPMPEKLWAAAIALAQEHGVYRISQDLGVNYDSLRTRLAKAKASPTRRRKSKRAPMSARKATARFVEIRAAQTAVATPAADAAVVVEVQDSSGAKLTIRLCRDAHVDVGALVDSFCGARRRKRR